MSNLVTEHEATIIRATARDGLYGEFVYPSRLWMPIEYAEASGRAKCRLCGEQIGKGIRCITFQFEADLDQWGRNQKAYIHIDCEEDSNADEGRHDDGEGDPAAAGDSG